MIKASEESRSAVLRKGQPTNEERLRMAIDTRSSRKGPNRRRASGKASVTWSNTGRVRLNTKASSG